ncbi:MAG: serine/threonine-protein kinase [Phycisphaerales bacterium]
MAPPPHTLGASDEDDSLRRIRTLFDRASDLPPEDRERFLKSQCPDDPEVVREVLELLERATDDPDDVAPFFRLDPSIVASSSRGPTRREHRPRAPVLQEGSTLRGMSIVRRIWASKSGDVYEGVRTATGERVAIKLLLAHADSDEYRRLRIEKLVHEQLSHPGIVPVDELAVADEGPAQGMPYLVMPYVNGKRIDEWVEAHEPKVEAIVRLVLDAAAAVNHANIGGVVHRDLKPSNILVSGSDLSLIVQVIDFGVAAMRQFNPAIEESLRAIGDDIVGTPEYMAPEQFSLLRPDMRADVYGLACTAYKLLSGSLPLDVEGRSLARIAQIKESRPPIPLTRRVGRRVPRLVSDVLEVALATERSARYENCAAFAEDLRRAMINQPLLRRPPSPVLRLALFARRQPLIAALVALVALAVATGIAAAAWQARIAAAQRDVAEARLQDTLRFAKWIMDDLDGALVDLPGSIPVRRRMVAEASAYLDRLTVGSADREDAELVMEVADARIRLGDTLANGAFGALGDRSSGLAQYRDALTLLDSTLPVGSSTRGMWLRARALEGVALCLDVDDPDYPGSLDQAMALLDQAAALEPRDTALLADRARMMVSHAYSKIYPDRVWSLALPGLEASVREARRVLDMDPSSDRSRRVLARSLRALGDTLGRLDRTQESVAALRESLSLWDQVHAVGGPDTGRISRNYERASTMNRLAAVLAIIGDRDEAERLTGESVRLARRGYDLDPESHTSIRALEVALSARAAALAEGPAARLRDGGALLWNDLADLTEARRCAVDAQALHERRRELGLLGPSEDYQGLLAGQIERIDAMFRAALPPGTPSP